MTPASTHLVLDSATPPARRTKGSSRRSKIHARTIDKTGAEFKCGGVAKQLPRLSLQRVPSDVRPR